MEELILSKLVSSLMSNESPSNIVMTCVVAYILHMLKGFRRDVQKLSDDVDSIKCHLGIKRNVIELPNNKKLDK